MENSDIQKNVIAICVADIQNEIEATICNSLAKCAGEQGYHAEFFSIFGDRRWERREDDDECLIYNLLPYEKLCGMVIFVEKFEPRHVEAFVAGGKQLGIPVICLEFSREDASSVMINYETGFEAVVKHVVEYHGCRRLFYVSGCPGVDVSDRRLEVYKKVLAENNIEFSKRDMGDGLFWSEPTREIMMELLSRKEPVPEAIVCASDTMAATVCDVLLEHGYVVPDDVIVTGFDGLSDADYHNPRITTVRPDYESMGHCAVSAIDDFKKTGVLEKRDYVVAATLVPSESCGCRPLTAGVTENRASKLYSKYVQYNTNEFGLIRMVSRATNTDNVKDMAEAVKGAIHSMMDCHYFYWCMSDDFIRFTDERRAMPRGLTCIASMVDGEFSSNPITLREGELIPDYEKHLHDGVPLLIYPVFVQGILYGYLAMGFKPEVTDLMNFRRFGQNINNIVGITVQRMSLNAAKERLQELYHTDVLTGLLNRAGFMDRKNALIAQNIGKTAVLINADLNNLKYINDTYGHKDGDAAITLAARILEEVVPRDGLVARYGGDEYAAMYVTDQRPDRVRLMFEAALEVEHMEANSKSSLPYDVHVSVGLSIATIDENYSFEECYKEADAAMYRAKHLYKEQHPTLGIHARPIA